MTNEELEIEVLDYDTQVEMFNKAVEEEVEHLKQKFNNSWSILKQEVKHLEEEVARYWMYFENVDEVKYLSRFERSKFMRSEPGKKGKEKYLPIKIFFELKVSGRGYDLSPVDNKNLPELRKVLRNENNFYLENQIKAEAYLQYYIYISTLLGKVAPEKVSQDTIEKVNNTQVLYQSERLIILFLLRDHKLFPKKHPSVEEGIYKELLSLIIGNKPGNLKNPLMMANRILGYHLKGNPNKDEARTWIRMLERVRTVFEQNKLTSIVEQIEARVNELTIFLNK